MYTHDPQKGFQLRPGSLGAHDMSGAVAVITEQVRGHLEGLRNRGGRPSRRVLLALDGCTQRVVVGQERVYLKDLLSQLFGALEAEGLSLTAAVTMRASGPAAPGQVGVYGEETVVVEELDARRCVVLFFFFFVLHSGTSFSAFASLSRDKDEEQISDEPPKNLFFTCFVVQNCCCCVYIYIHMYVASVLLSYVVVFVCCSGVFLLLAVMFVL